MEFEFINQSEFTQKESNRSVLGAELRKIVRQKIDLEVNIMFRMSKPIIEKVKNNRFSRPKKHFLFPGGQKHEKVETLSVSTIDSERSQGKVREANAKLQKHLIHHQICVKTHRVLKKLEFFKKVKKAFLELSIASGDVNRSKTAELAQNLQKNYLMLTNNLDKFSCHQNESIALSFVLKTVVETKLSKKMMIETMSQIFRNRKIRISCIRKTKSYKQLMKLSSS